MQLKRMRLLILMLVLMLIASCAWFGAQTKLNPKQQATVWMSIYNSTYDDTLSVMKNPASTPAQKELALKKKVILTQVWPLMKVYVATTESGAAPTLADTAAITDLINQLALLAGGV